MKKLSLVLALLLLTGCAMGGGNSGGSSVGGNAGSSSNSGNSGDSSAVGNAGSSSNSGNSGVSVNVKDAVDAAYATVLEENKVATMEMDKDTIISYFGLDESMVEDAYGIGPMMSAHVDMIVGIKATKGNADKVEDAIEAYQDALEKDTMQYPMNLAAISEAEVFSEGGNVYYVRLNTYSSNDSTEDQTANTIESINDKAENAIEALHK